MSDDAASDLIGALIENMMRAGDDWESFAMVLTFEGESVFSVSGYAYDPDGSINAIAALVPDVQSAILAYAASVFTPGQPMPKKMLVQCNRDTGRFNVEFEDDDDARWKVSPATIATIREELRPQLG